LHREATIDDLMLLADGDVIEDKIAEAFKPVQLLGSDPKSF
jgi:hypothetical protein